MLRVAVDRRADHVTSGRMVGSQTSGAERILSALAWTWIRKAFIGEEVDDVQPPHIELVTDVGQLRILHRLAPPFGGNDDQASVSRHRDNPRISVGRLGEPNRAGGREALLNGAHQRVLCWIRIQEDALMAFYPRGELISRILQLAANLARRYHPPVNNKLLEVLPNAREHGPTVGAPLEFDEDARV